MPRMLFLARHSGGVEPLGLHYLVQVAINEGWECEVVLVRGSDFEPFYEMVNTWKPNLVACHTWTGYHLPMFSACDWVRERGIPVIMGGPHATYSHEQCVHHADWVVRGSGFRYLQQALKGTLSKGVHFNAHGRREMFPVPSRRPLYDRYPEFAKSPIKSHFCSVGCPYHCTYCYADKFNEMHGGFDLILRSIDDVIREAQIVMEGWPETKMFYFQDDVFGFDLRWLEEFARRWKSEVGVPFHCQMRLEMTRHLAGDRRLDLLAKAGCTGITLAIESGSAFLRKEVLFRAMPHELIVEGCRKIMARGGMSLRTEQILAVPFSDIATDLGTLALNREINPTHAWASILSPYPFVNIGRMATAFGMFSGDQDGLLESFFLQSVMRHLAGGPCDIERIVASLQKSRQKEPLLRMHAVRREGSLVADVFYTPDAREVSRGDKEVENVGQITFLSDSENAHYCMQTARLHRFFNWLPRLPYGEELGRILVDVPESEWTWARVGRETFKHLRKYYSSGTLEGWVHSLAYQMGCASPDDLPQAIAQNPLYFCYFTGGGELARTMLRKGVFDPIIGIDKALIGVNNEARNQIFETQLYRIRGGPARIAR